MLEFFRPDHGHEQIPEQQERDNADDDGFHLYSYSFSQSSVYSAPTIKNRITTPAKIRSFIIVGQLNWEADQPSSQRLRFTVRRLGAGFLPFSWKCA